MRQRSLKGYLLLGSALVTCPCHLPLIATLLAGTALGGFLREHAALLVLALGAYFVLALLLGLRLLMALPSEQKPTFREKPR